MIITDFKLLGRENQNIDENMLARSGGERAYDDDQIDLNMEPPEEVNLETLIGKLRNFDSINF